MIGGNRWRGGALVVIALCVGGILYAATQRSRRLTPANAAVPVATTGSFQPNGWYQGEAFAHAEGVRAWGSWSGDDANTGSIEIGPFPAPRVLRFGAGGYPNQNGNTLYVELLGTGRRQTIRHGPIRERWELIDVILPDEWFGRPIRVVGVDHSTQFAGWFAISEPIRGGRGEPNRALLESVASWLINALLLGIVFAAAVRVLLVRRTLPPQWIALAAGGLVAVGAYLVFWAFFASPRVGVIATWLLIAGAAAVVAWPRRHRAPAGTPDLDEIKTPVVLMFAIGAFYLALLHLFPSDRDFYSLAANRFREALPSDNMLSHELAERFFEGKPVRNLGYEWLSSDRPPLQTGWELITWPAGKLLDLDPLSMSGTAAVWFQLLWVAAAYGLLRTFDLTRRSAAAWLAACALAGFFVQNTVFTWPKLAAGAFTIGAFALLAIKRPAPNPRWVATFGALGWLTHGAVAFSFIALLPWLVWRSRGRPRREVAVAAALFAVLVVPWTAYQKLYEPPANRLLKWHLAGQSKIDPRGTWETIRDSYEAIGWRQAWTNKAANFEAQFIGTGWNLIDVSGSTQVERRNHEFFHTVRGLTWWPVLTLLSLVVMGTPRLAVAGDLGALVGWVIATIIVWCLLMFEPYAAVIHQGSYAVMIGLFVLCSIVLARGGRWWLAPLAALQAITLITTWAPGNTVIHGTATGLPFVLLAACPLLWCIAQGVRAQNPVEATAPIAPTATASGAATGLAVWWKNPRLTVWLWLGLALLLFLRKSHALHTPQLWAEDGTIFLNDEQMHGLAALLKPYMGYLHLLPRIIAWVAARLLDPVAWPAFYNGVAFAIWLAAIARFFSQRFDLPGKPWLALAFVLVPHSGEVFFNITNLQWITGFVLFQQTLIRSPVTRGERIADVAILTVVSLTGPFAIAFLPLFAWRWWRLRNRDSVVALAIVLAAAAIQTWFVMRTGPKFEFQSEPFHPARALEIIDRRVAVWPMLGHDRTLELPSWAVHLFGGTLLLALAIWALRPHPRRLLRAQVLAAFVLIVIAGVYRARPDTWTQDKLDFAERYFYIPRVLFAWLLIWEFDALPRIAAGFARLLCFFGVLANLGDYRLGPPKNYHWAEHVEPIRRGVPANIPILPEGWTLEYHGRPR